LGKRKSDGKNLHSQLNSYLCESEIIQLIVQFERMTRYAMNVVSADTSAYSRRYCDKRSDEAISRDFSTPLRFGRNDVRFLF
jgi:hypothetical protein